MSSYESGVIFGYLFMLAIIFWIAKKLIERVRRKEE